MPSNMSEVWTPVVGYEGLYEISDSRRVRSVDRIVRHGHRRRGRVLKQTIDPCGYMTVSLSKANHKRTKRVHSLVAEAFIGPRPYGMEVLHGAKGLDDNSISNLSYGTRQQNARNRARDNTNAEGESHGMSKLTDDDVVEIRRQLRNGAKQRDVAQAFNVTQCPIARIATGRGWKHITKGKHV